MALSWLVRILIHSMLSEWFYVPCIPVRQSKNPCLVGLSGIVVHETENAFKVISQRDEMKCTCDDQSTTFHSYWSGCYSSVLPKHNSVFAFAVPLFSTSSPPPADKPTNSSDTSNSEPKWTVLDGPHIEFELYGNQFRFRSADRAGRKFKAKETIEL